jgi:hypothetical protein
MKPAPNVPGETPAERRSNALRMVLTVSKKDMLKKESQLKRRGSESGKHMPINERCHHGTGEDKRL